MRFLVLLALLMISPWARADLVFAPRYEYIRGQEDELANRLILKGKLNSNLGPFGIFIEGFGDFEGNEDQAYIRRSPSKGYLQEAYLEFKLDSFYVRVGRQAIRWSEMWSLPSLDVWSGRRWARLFFDPFQDQLTHPTGASFSYARETWSLDLVGIGDVAESTYPIPAPEPVEEKNTSFGGRLKMDVKGFGLSLVSAQILNRNHYGFTANYAFETAVPKFEYGYVDDTTLPDTIKSDRSFGTVGMDLFLGNWVVLPQVTAYEVNTLTGTQTQVSYYVSAQWNPNRHDVFFQLYQNDTTKDLFVNASYGYNWTDYFTSTIFAQSYQGKDGGLYDMYEEITGGYVVGLRLEFTGSLPF
ncbi:hypothetical protein [Bdellovibrio bacteriovorus]|uniref:hypothetical protein n=1 Tax=Bdellovibrio bacteriovorus TaxID=959 RepID=UPI003D03F605